MSDSPLVDHARAELARAGMYDADADYGGGAIAGAVLDLVQVFADQEHSGGSAMLTLGIVEKLLRFQPLTPITSDPDEWVDRTEISGYPLWQSKRNPAVFSPNGGQTWYDLDKPIVWA